MGKTYKVHRFFDVDEMTLQEPCECSAPESGFSILINCQNVTEKENKICNYYNSTSEGLIFTEENIAWSDLKKSDCEA